jgi:hypothetical protein
VCETAVEPLLIVLLGVPSPQFMFTDVPAGEDGKVKLKGTPVALE